jgi:hypothetical protein
MSNKDTLDNFRQLALTWQFSPKFSTPLSPA